MQCTGQIVRENIHDDTKYLIIFKGISFTDSSLNDLIDFEEEQKKANSIKIGDKFCPLFFLLFFNRPLQPFAPATTWPLPIY